MSSSLDLKAITEKFFAAYDGHDVDGMLALCADGAQGRYLPYGKKSDMPIRGGLEQIWRGLLGAVPDFGVEVVEMIQGEGNIVVVQALLGGAMPADWTGFSGLARVVLLFDGRDVQALADARAAWKEAKDAGHDVTYWKETPAGKFEKQN